MQVQSYSIDHFKLRWASVGFFRCLNFFPIFRSFYTFFPDSSILTTYNLLQNMPSDGLIAQLKVRIKCLLNICQNKILQSTRRSQSLSTYIKNTGHPP